MSLCLFMGREKRIGKERDKLQKRKRKDVSLKVFHPNVHFEDYQNFRLYFLPPANEVARR